MTSWKAFCEWYLGLPASSRGEGTQWEWMSQPFWPPGWPAWLTLVVTIALGLGLVWSYRREAARLSAGARLLLTALRCAALCVGLVLWTQPTLVIARSGLPAVIVLFDTSASMTFRDAAAQPSSVTANASPEAVPSRWEQVASAVTTRDSQFLRELTDSHPVRFYQFSQTATSLPLERTDESADIVAFVEQLRQLSPTGRATRPAESVRQVLSDLRGSPPAAIIVLTDGIASESEADRLSTIADLLRRRGTELYAVPVGSSEPSRDVQLFDVAMDDMAFVGDPVVISGKIRTRGLDAKTAQVRVSVEGQPEQLVQQQVTLKAGDGGTTFEVTFTADQPADWELVIEVPSVTGETDLNNNRERRHISIREERLNVLLIESAPRYEFRYLKQWLERDKSVTVRTLLTDADPEYAQEDRTALPYFPVVKEELWQYDVIILGDVSPAELGSTAAEWIETFVREKGGGLVFIAGPQSNPATLARTPLELLLPFVVSAADASAFEEPNAEEYRARLTLDGQKGVPMFRLAESELASLETWNNLPGFFGLLPITRVKPGTRVLAEHPYRPAEVGKLPVILLQQYGAGKVLYHATDELWRWRFRTGDTHFGRYWGQAVRYLSRGRLLGKDRSAELVVDRQTYLQGEPVLLRVRFLDDRLAPSDDDGVQVVLERRGEGRREITLHRLPHLPMVFETQVTGLAEGFYHAWMSRPSFEVAPPVADFRVESLDREMQRRAVDRLDLQAAVKTAGGAVVELEDLAELPSRIPIGRPIPFEQGRRLPLWSRWEPLLLMMGLLVTEWVLRRRWQLS
ncbi:hypothetical protein GC163_14140 [bacterium]|nr:hypothetical protein [bacterium]